MTSGLLFDLQIFLEFILIFEANVNDDQIQNKSHPTLGGWWSLKSNLFDAIVYPALQARTQRIDYKNFKKGISNVANGHDPDPIDFSKGVPNDFAGFGKTHFFGISGDKYFVGGRERGVVDIGSWSPVVRIFQKLCQAKTSHLELQNPNKITNRRGV